MCSPISLSGILCSSIVHYYTFVLSQLQRNILATCPRVTRFKIDWGNGDEADSENVPPPNSTESESNQMATTDSNHAAPKNTQEETMDAPLPSKSDSSSTAASSSVNPFNGICGADSNNAMDMVPGHAVPVNGGCGEPMQLWNTLPVHENGCANTRNEILLLYSHHYVHVQCIVST